MGEQQGMDEVVVDNTSDGHRAYAEVSSADGVIRVHAEDEGDHAVELALTPAEALALMNALGRAVAAAIA